MSAFFQICTTGVLSNNADHDRSLMMTSRRSQGKKLDACVMETKKELLERQIAMDELDDTVPPMALPLDELDGTIKYESDDTIPSESKSYNNELEKAKLLLCIFIILILLNQVDKAEGVWHCRDDQHEVKKGNQFVSCRDCPSCAKGFELTPPCGGIINIDTKVKCKECVLGVTYSKYHGTDSCHPCTVCSSDQVIESECTLTSNRECDVKCKSQHKYYASKVKHDCQNCSWCCGTSDDDRQQECVDKGMPRNKQCSIDQAERCRPSTLSATQTPNTETMPTSLPAEASSSSSTDGDQGDTSGPPHTDSLESKLLLGIILPVTSVALIVGLIIWCKCCRNSSLSDSDKKERKAEEGQSVEMESTDLDGHDTESVQSDAPADERCHGSYAQYRAVKRQGSVDSDVGKLHSAVVKCCRGQQSTEELMKEPNNSYQDVEIGIEASREAKSTTQLDKRRLSELFTVAEFMDICQLLECKPETLSRCGDYKDVAEHNSMPYHSICALKRENSGPAHALITWLVARTPCLTVEEFAVSLTTKKINRPDIVEILRKYYYCN